MKAAHHWTQALVILILMFQFADQDDQRVLVRDGVGVTLPCGKLRDSCDRPTWRFGRFATAGLITLVNQGQIGLNSVSRAKSDRLSITRTCSLAIKEVTRDDVGFYVCEHQGKLSWVDLSIVNITEHRTEEEITLHCSVLTRSQSDVSQWTAIWQFCDEDLDEDTPELQISKAGHLAKLTVAASRFVSLSKDCQPPRCSVTNRISGEEQLFIFSPQTQRWWRWWLHAAAAAASLVVLLIIAVIVKWKLTKVKRQQGSGSVASNNTQIYRDALRFEMSLKPAEMPSGEEAGHDKNEISYASVRFIRTDDNQDQVPSGCDEEEPVTYSSVKYSSPESLPSNQPSANRTNNASPI